MKLLLVTIVVVTAYSLLFWITCIKSQKTSEAIWFIGSSVITFLVLGGLMLVNMFWVLFLAFLVLVVSTYIGGNKKIAQGALIKNGTFGGFWLLAPLYVLFATNT